jgi:hypothetical protein
MSDEKKSTGLKYDHHGYLLDDPSLRGFKRHFNSSTIHGRANVAKLTIACLVGAYTYTKIKKVFWSSTSADDENNQEAAGAVKAIKP